MVWSNHLTCRAIKKDGNRCKYFCGDNFMCGIHAHKAESLQCSICHEDMIRSQSTTTDCNHTFHIECYEEWRNQSNGNSCPLCREKIPKLDRQEIQSLTNTFREHSIKYYKDVEDLFKAFELLEDFDKIDNMRILLIKNNFNMIELINDKLRMKPCRNDAIFIKSMSDHLYKLNDIFL